MIKRAIGFKIHDWKHLWWLFKNMNSQLFKGNYLEAYDSWMWIKIHFCYDSKKKQEVRDDTEV